MILKDCQRAALEHVRQYGASRREAAQETIVHILEMSNIALEDFTQALLSIQSHARVALHFHPNRLLPNLINVADSPLAAFINCDEPISMNPDRPIKVNLLEVMPGRTLSAAYECLKKRWNL